MIRGNKEPGNRNTETTNRRNGEEERLVSDSPRRCFSDSSALFPLTAAVASPRRRNARWYNPRNFLRPVRR